MYEAGVKLTEGDFEFSKPLYQKSSFTSYSKSISWNTLLISEAICSSLKAKFRTPYARKCHSQVPENIELVFDFIVRERIQMIRYEKGVLYRSAVPGLSDYERQ